METEKNYLSKAEKRRIRAKQREDEYRKILEESDRKFNEMHDMLFPDLKEKPKK